MALRFAFCKGKRSPTGSRLTPSTPDELSVEVPGSPRAQVAAADMLPPSAKPNDLAMSAINTPALPITLSVCRNIQGFTMIATQDVAERELLEDTIERILYTMEAKPEWSGESAFPVTPCKMHTEYIRMACLTRKRSCQGVTSR